MRYARREPPTCPKLGGHVSLGFFGFSRAAHRLRRAAVSMPLSDAAKAAVEGFLRSSPPCRHTRGVCAMDAAADVLCPRTVSPRVVSVFTVCVCVSGFPALACFRYGVSETATLALSMARARVR